MTKYSLIMKFILNRSPKSQLQKLQKVFTNTNFSRLNTLSNQNFISNLISEIQCEDLIPSPYKRSSYYNEKINQVTIQKLSKVQLNTNQRLLNITKSLQKIKVSFILFSQAIQLITFMNPNLIVQNKKHLSYLYRILAKNSNKYSPIYNSLVQDLKQIVIKRIYESTIYQEKNRKNAYEKILKELLKQAKQKKQIGDLTLARQKYEKLYRYPNAQQQLRIQALYQKGDSQYLKKIMQQIKVKGQEKHEKVVQKFIEALNIGQIHKQ